jgi:hypothetical protein
MYINARTHKRKQREAKENKPVNRMSIHVND